MRTIVLRVCVHTACLLVAQTARGDCDGPRQSFTRSPEHQSSGSILSGCTHFGVAPDPGIRPVTDIRVWLSCPQGSQVFEAVRVNAK